MFDNGLITGSITTFGTIISLFLNNVLPALS